VDLKQIETFWALMATGSTIAAAAELRLSQPAVSRQLARLDSELGFTLFDSSKWRLVDGSEAHAFLGEVEPLSERPSRQAMDAVFSRQGAPVAGRVQVHSVASACALVAEGLGVTVATRFMALLFGARLWRCVPSGPRCIAPTASSARRGHRSRSSPNTSCRNSPPR